MRRYEDEASARQATLELEAIQYRPPTSGEEEVLHGVVVKPARNLWRVNHS